VDRGRLLAAVRFDEASPFYANGPSDLGPMPRSLISIGHGLTSMSTAFAVQFGAFVFVLGLLVDMQAIRRAGGTWRDLLKVYALHDIFDVAAAGLPAALLAIALVQQISTGAGADVADAIISGVTDMSSAIKPKGT
jgi:hypothetical protein